MELRQEDIAKLAYQFYLEDGKTPGHADEHWTRAMEFLSHPENHSDTNVLSPPSEPELTRALDEKGRLLDTNLPSNPATGSESLHQKMEIATERTSTKDTGILRQTLRKLPGVEKVEVKDGTGRVEVSFDARKTNPAEIHEALLSHGYKPSATPHR